MSKIDSKALKVFQYCKKDPVFFAERFLINEEGNPLVLEPHQKLFLRDPYRYKAFLCSRRSGKSLTIAIDMFHKSLFRMRSKYALVTATQKQAKQFSNTFNDLIERSPMAKNEFEFRNTFDNKLKNGSRMEFATAGSSSGKKEDSALVGSGVHGLYLDESQSLTADQLGVILPIVTGQTGKAYITFSGTPRGKSGIFYDVITNAKYITENGKKILNDEKKQYSLHRFQITDLDENDNVAWSKAEYRLTIDELEVIKGTIGVEKFKREYCLEFLDSITKPYYDTLIEECGILKKPPNFKSTKITCAGVDFGKVLYNSVISVGELGPDNRWRAPYYKSWPTGTKYNIIASYINNILPKRFPNLQYVAFDTTGVGQGIIEMINEDTPFKQIEVVFSQPAKVDLVESSVYTLEEQKLLFYKHPTLVTEMKDYNREITDNGRTIYTKGNSDDFVDAFNLMHRAIRECEEKGIVKNKGKTPLSASLGLKTTAQKNNNNYRSLRNTRRRY